MGKYMWRGVWLGFMCDCEWRPALPVSTLLVFLPGVPNACYTHEEFLHPAWPFPVFAGSLGTWIFISHLQPTNTAQGSVSGCLPHSLRHLPTRLLHADRWCLLMLPENELSWPVWVSQAADSVGVFLRWCHTTALVKRFPGIYVSIEHNLCLPLFHL